MNKTVFTEAAGDNSRWDDEDSANRSGYDDDG